MTEYLFLFHSTVGLCIYLSCEPGEEQRWILPGQTEALFRVAGDDYQLLAQFPQQA